MTTRTLTKAGTSTPVTTASPPKPTQKQMVNKIVEEATAAGVFCTRQTANELIGTLRRALRHNRRTGEHYFLTQRQLDTVHPVLDAIMPDHPHSSPAPGGAWATLNRGLLDDNEVSLRHSMANRFSRRFCTVTTDVITLN